MSLSELSARIVEHNDQRNSIVAKLLASKRSANSFHKEELAGLTEAQQLAAFESSIEQELEDSAREAIEQPTTLVAPHSPTFPATPTSFLEKLRIKKQAEALAAEEMAPESEPERTELSKGIQESFSLNIVLNEKQLVAKDFAFQGKSFCLIGPAGTGKTTAQRAVAGALLEDGRLELSSYKYTDIATGFSSMKEAPSIAFVAYTRRAASNMRKAIHKDPILAEKLKFNIMTIHALLEYRPETYWDSVEMKEKFRFAPTRNAENPLTITHLVIEEASMLGLDLWDKLYDALPYDVQIIFVGDINQLPPVFGPSILNYALTQLPIVELTEVYRNQGIVLENAHNILNGRKLLEDKDFHIVRGKNPTQLGQGKMCSVVTNMLKVLSSTIGDDGLPEYDVENDMILSPFNKQGGRGEKSDLHLGTNAMNKWIAQFVGERRGAIVHEIIAGFNKLYLAEGDKVMFNKRDGVIKSINRNLQYHGKEPQLPGKDLSRFGTRLLGVDSDLDFDDMAGELDYSNFSLEALEDEKGERKQQASHSVVIDYGDGMEEEVTAAGDFSEASFTLGYCLTVHKAQGSEWRKVFILLHKDHAIMLFRELFYTAETRARTKVTIIAKDYIIDQAISNQRIKGSSLKDKLAFFNSGINDTVSVTCTKPSA